jgi:hypothetical protein
MGSSIENLVEVLAEEQEAYRELAAKLAWGHATSAAEASWSLALVELDRSLRAQAVAADLGLHGEVRLRDLIAAAPPTWSDLLDRQRVCLIDLTAEVEALDAAGPWIDLDAEAEGGDDGEGDGHGGEEPWLDLDDPDWSQLPVRMQTRPGVVRRSLRDFLS